MKTLRTSGAACLFLCLLLLSILRSPLSAAGAESSRVRRLLKNPPRQYSTGPLWVWNDLLTEAEIRDTLRDLARQKVKQVWVHPRPARLTVTAHASPTSRTASDHLPVLADVGFERR